MTDVSRIRVFYPNAIAVVNMVFPATFNLISLKIRSRPLIRAMDAHRPIISKSFPHFPSWCRGRVMNLFFIFTTDGR
jgi:hypothetical protein